MTSECVLTGLDGTNPLAFLAALGVLSLGSTGDETLAWTDEIVPHAVVTGFASSDEIVECAMVERRAWRDVVVLNFLDGGRVIDDVKLSPEALRAYIDACRKADDGGRSRALVAALVAEGGRDNNGAAKPTDLHFTAGQQKFLRMARELVSGLQRGDVEEALLGPWSYSSELKSFMWDVTDDRVYSVSAYNPSNEKKYTMPGAEFLALLGLRAFPVFANGTHTVTTACWGSWKQGEFGWPLWSVPVPWRAAVALVAHANGPEARWRVGWGVREIVRCRIGAPSKAGTGRSLRREDPPSARYEGVTPLRAGRMGRPPVSDPPRSPRHPAVIAAQDGAVPAADDVPALVPARMVNEFTYCPRLFFLEWVEARFAQNDDTRIGEYEHRAVDLERGGAPLPDEAQPLIEARSVMLSSERLGLVARIDIIEGGGDGSVTPVDFKKGRPPESDERSWEPERVQLCVQGLLLRDVGYSCARGVIYYAQTRERVVVQFTDELVERTLAVVSELREVAASEVPPPPLVASPKCPRCSLVGICLPDETNALATRTDAPVRRLVPRAPDPRPLYVTEHGAYVGIRGGRIEVTKDRENIASLRLIDVSQLCIYGNAQVSTQLLRELMAREIPVCWFSYGGWFAGMAHGLPAKYVELRRRQMARAHDAALPIARRVIEGKIRNSRTLLRRNARDRPDGKLDALRDLAAKAKDAPSVSTLLGIEGAAARLYFEAFPSMLSPRLDLPGGSFTFDGRNRRPPLDAVNCLLSYLYSLLVKELTVQTFVVGFDPYVGFYHRPRFGRPALALDLAEEFRPLIAESVVVNLLNNGEIRPSHFIVRAGGVALTADGRRRVLAGYERRLDTEIRHPTFGYRISYRRVLDVQARLLGACLMGEIDEYVPFVTR